MRDAPSIENHPMHCGRRVRHFAWSNTLRGEWIPRQCLRSQLFPLANREHRLHLVNVASHLPSPRGQVQKLEPSDL